MRRLLPAIILTLITLPIALAAYTGLVRVEAQQGDRSGGQGSNPERETWRVEVRGEKDLLSGGDRDRGSISPNFIGQVIGDQIVYVPIYDKGAAAPGENITVGVVALGAAGPIPGKTFNYTVYGEYSGNPVYSVSLTTNDLGIAFFNLTSSQSRTLGLAIPLDSGAYTVEYIYVSSIGSMAISPTIAVYNSSGKDIIKIALVDMATKKAYSGQLNIELNIRVHRIDGTLVNQTQYNLTVGFQNGLASINVTELLGNLSLPLQCIAMNITDCVYVITLQRIGDVTVITHPIYVVQRQELINMLASISSIIPTFIYHSVNRTFQGSIAFLVRQAEYRLLTGTMTIYVTMYNATFGFITSKTLNISVASGIGILDLSTLGEIPSDVARIEISPVGFIGEGNNIYFIIHQSWIIIVRQTPVSALYRQAPQGLVLDISTTQYFDPDRYIVSVTVYYNGTPLPDVPVRIYVPNPQSPSATARTDARGVASFDLYQLYPRARSVEMAYNDRFTYLVTATWGNMTVYNTYSVIV